MGLEKIKEEILQKAESAEKAILAEAATKVEQIKNTAKGKIRQLEEAAAQKHSAEQRVIINKEQSLANLEAQKLIFETKRDTLNKTYSQAFEKIKKIPRAEREAIIRKLLQRAQKEIDVKIVYANDTDATFIDKSFTTKPLDTEGGIICETEDGTVRVDYTFSTLFQELREKTIQKTSKILF